MAKVSVVITTYKRQADILKRAVGSVLNQSLKDLEVIVVDDNHPEDRSIYNAERVLSDLGDTRVRYIAHDENMGAPAARNTGIENALGEYICFLDDDDEYYPAKLEKQLASLEDTGLKFSVCGYEIHDEETGDKRTVLPRFGRGNKGAYLCGRNYIATPNPLIARECFINCGSFDIEMRSAQDLELWIRILDKYDAALVKEPLYVQHLHPGERISANPARQLEGVLRLIEKNEAMLSAHFDARARLYLVAAKRYLQLGDEAGAKQYAFKAAVSYPPYVFRAVAMIVFWGRKYGDRR